MLAQATGTSYDIECVSVSVCHKAVFYRHGWTDRAGFWHVSFFRPIIHCFQEIHVTTKIRVLPSGTLSQTPDLENLLRRIDRQNVLSTQLEKRGCSERNKQDRRRSTKLTVPPNFDARPLQFITGDRQALSTARVS